MFALLCVIIICSLPFIGIAHQTDTEDDSSLMEMLQGENLLEVSSSRTSGGSEDLELAMDTGSGDEEYPSSEPDFGGLSINFTTSFIITNMYMEDFKADKKDNFTDLAQETFGNVVGFTVVNIKDIRNGSVHVDLSVGLKVDDLNRVPGDQWWTAVSSSLVDACTQMVQSPVFNITNDTEGWTRSAMRVNDTLLELCNLNITVVCGWGQRLVCVDGKLSCRHMCEGVLCLNAGTCIVTGTAASAECRCKDDEWNSYSGAQCELSHLKWSVILGITCGVGGALLVLLGGALAVTWWRNRRSKQNSLNSVNGSLNGANWGSARGFGKQLFKQSFYRDEGWSPTYRMFRSGNGWEEEGEGYSTQGHDPALTPSFQHVDTQTPIG